MLDTMLTLFIEGIEIDDNNEITCFLFFFFFIIIVREWKSILPLFSTLFQKEEETLYFYFTVQNTGNFETVLNVQDR